MGIRTHTWPTLALPRRGAADRRGSRWQLQRQSDLRVTRADRGEPITPQTDIYAVGILLYELLVGPEAVLGPDLGRLPEGSTPDRAAAHRPAAGLPAALDGTIRRATAKLPAERFASVAELVAEVRAAIGERPTAHDAAVRPATAAPVTGASTSLRPTIPTKACALSMRRMRLRSLGARDWCTSCWHA